MPLFKGAVNKDMLTALAENDPWEYIMEQKTHKKLSLLEPMSAVVRLLDSQREVKFFYIYNCKSKINLLVMKEFLKEKNILLISFILLIEESEKNFC